MPVSLRRSNRTLSRFNWRSIGYREEDKGKTTKSREARNPDEADLLPGSVSRLNAFVPERIAQIEHLYQELLAQAEARHKALSRRTHRQSSRQEYQPGGKRSAGRRAAKPFAPATEGCREALPVLGRGGRRSSPASLFGALANCKSGCGLKGKTFSRKSRALLGYGHLEKIVSAYQKWRTHASGGRCD